MNINYICNNKCIFCISHNTKNSSRVVAYPFDIVSAVDRDFHLNSQDVFVINGGEPTLSEDFFQVVSFLSLKCSRVIVYTNGRLFSNASVQQALKIGNVRWIIPFYGLEVVHAKLCGDEKAFYETYNNLVYLNEAMRKKIDVKILLNNDISENEIQQLADTFQDFACLHISCLNNKNDIENRLAIINRLKKCILPLFSITSIVKLSNIPLCALEEEGKLEFAKFIDSSMSESIHKYYFVDVDGTKIINYNRQHNWLKKCTLCKMRYICIDTNCHFQVAVYQKNKIWLGEE